jgi:hypothetical protein
MSPEINATRITGNAENGPFQIGPIHRSHGSQNLAIVQRANNSADNPIAQYAAVAAQSSRMSALEVLLAPIADVYIYKFPICAGS